MSRCIKGTDNIKDKNMAEQKKQTKEYRGFHCKLDKALNDRLDRHAEETYLSKTATVERALKMYFEHYDRTGQV